jgi:hypothetical protein
MCVYIYIYIVGGKKNYIPLYPYLSAMTSNIEKTGPRPSPAAATACSTSSVALSACGAPGGSSRARSRNVGRQDPGTRDDIFEYNWVYKWWISIHICSYIYIYNYIYSYVVNIYEYLCEKLNNGGIHQHCVTIDYRLLSFIIDSSCLFWTI